MRVLIDTHVLLWAATTPQRLKEQQARVADTDTELLWSAASSWEIAIKAATGRLSLPGPPRRFVVEAMQRLDIIPLPVEHSHALAVADLPDHHRDPFDRLLIAQAQVLGVPLMTADHKLQAYDIEVLPI